MRTKGKYLFLKGLLDFCALQLAESLPTDQGFILQDAVQMQMIFQSRQNLCACPYKPVYL